MIDTQNKTEPVVTEREVAEMQMSPTLNKIAAFAADLPNDMTDSVDAKSVFTVCLIDLCRAEDRGEITFKNTNAAAMFHGLLAASLAYINDGKVVLEEASVQ